MRLYTDWRESKKGALYTSKFNVGLLLYVGGTPNAEVHYSYNTQELGFGKCFSDWKFFIVFYSVSEVVSRSSRWTNSLSSWAESEKSSEQPLALSIFRKAHLSTILMLMLYTVICLAFGGNGLQFTRCFVSSRRRESVPSVKFFVLFPLIWAISSSPGCKSSAWWTRGRISFFRTTGKIQHLLITSW